MTPVLFARIVNRVGLNIVVGVPVICPSSTFRFNPISFKEMSDDTSEYTIPTKFDIR